MEEVVAEDVFTTVWFPALRARSVAELHAFPRASVVAELAQRYGSAPVRVFEAEVHDTELRAEVRAWWARHVEKRTTPALHTRAQPAASKVDAYKEAARLYISAARAEDAAGEAEAMQALLHASTYAAADYYGHPVMAESDELETNLHPEREDMPRPTFGYDADAPLPAVEPRGKDEDAALRAFFEQAVCRGDADAMLRLLRSGRWVPRFTATARSAEDWAAAGLLDLLVSLQLGEEAAAALVHFGHTTVIERLVEEAQALTAGTARHRDGVIRKAAVFFQAVVTEALNFGGTRVPIAERLLVHPIAFPRPQELVQCAIQAGSVTALERSLAVRTAERTQAVLDAAVVAALKTSHPELLVPLYAAGASTWGVTMKEKQANVVPADDDDDVDEEEEEDDDDDVDDGNSSSGPQIQMICLAAAHARAAGWGQETLDTLVARLDAQGVRWALAHNVPVRRREAIVETALKRGVAPTRILLGRLQALLEAGFPVTQASLAMGIEDLSADVAVPLAEAFHAGGGTVAQLRATVVAKLKRNGSGMDATPLFTYLRTRWNIQLDGPMVAGLLRDGGPQCSAAVIDAVTHKPSLATATLMRAAVRAAAVPVVDLLRTRGLRLPADAVKLTRDQSYAEGAVMRAYLRRHRCVGYETVTDADCEPDADAPEAVASAVRADAETLAPVQGLLPTLLSPGIALERARAPVVPGTLRLGSSHIGGLPDLPPAVPWPTTKTDPARPLAHFLQLNLAEVAAAAADVAATAACAGRDDLGLLPTTGWLWLFMAMGDGDIEEDTIPLYWDGPVTELVRTRHPHDGDLDEADLTEFGIGFAAFPLGLRRVPTLHPLDPPTEGFTRAQRSALYDLFHRHNDAAYAQGMQSLSIDIPGARWTASVWGEGLQLLGHPHLVQSDIIGYVPESVVRAFAGMPARSPRRRDNNAVDVHADSDEEEDDGDDEEEEEEEDEEQDNEEDDLANKSMGHQDKEHSGEAEVRQGRKRRKTAEGQDDEAEASDGSEASGRVGRFVDVVESVRQHNARLAQRADADVLAERRGEWLLLLQVPGDRSVRFYPGAANVFVYDGVEQESAFDNGTIYVCMRRADLRARRFDKFHVVYQCT